MIANRENNTNNPPNANEVSIQLVMKSVLCFLLMMFLAQVIIKYKYEPEVIEFVFKNETKIHVEVEGNSGVVLNKIDVPEKVEKKIIKQIVKLPSCPKSYMLVILEEICNDLIVKKELCTPEDFYNHKKHKIPRTIIRRHLDSEPKVPAIINYAVGGLLITSVGAALIELYKAKKQPPKKNGKNPLSRKCSLADLTVMKHNRKELIRRDSILEVPEESSHLKQLGFIPPPLHRRCSYPVGPHTTIANSGLSHDNRIFSESSRKMSVVDSRRASVVDSRKTSVDYRNNSVDERRISVDDSPERRHHRLVHRH